MDCTESGAGYLPLLLRAAYARPSRRIALPCSSGLEVGQLAHREPLSASRASPEAADSTGHDPEPIAQRLPTGIAERPATVPVGATHDGLEHDRSGAAAVAGHSSSPSSPQSGHEVEPPS